MAVVLEWIKFLVLIQGAVNGNFSALSVKSKQMLVKFCQAKIDPVEFGLNHSKLDTFWKENKVNFQGYAMKGALISFGGKGVHQLDNLFSLAGSTRNWFGKEDTVKELWGLIKNGINSE